MDAEGTYMYSIIAAQAPEKFGPIGIGGRGDECRTVHHEGLAAVVSVSPAKKFKVSRDNLLAHEKVIEAVMLVHTVLPVRFGTVADNDGKVKLILAREYDRFLELLRNLEGKRELGVKAVFKEEAVFKMILDKYEDIRAMKEKIAALPAEKTHFQRAEIGRMVEVALQKEKDTRQAVLLDALAPLALEVKTNGLYGDMMILNAAFLVEQSREPEFDKKVQELAEQNDESVKFKYVGTVPPFNFVNLVIEMGDL
ncbi:MAG: GvpL/GvpF family gas vesicle protein [Verrucomicrobia bacterium]|nr:GvpL/GvpF family gas vesicle protein [Verrucomicrobiota bacterium]MBU1857722.1 GvpL/GvpF family gas vesicle protein [Verrucomicrobiota bacterium]